MFFCFPVSDSEDKLKIDDGDDDVEDNDSESINVDGKSITSRNNSMDDDSANVLKAAEKAAKEKDAKAGGGSDSTKAAQSKRIDKWKAKHEAMLSKLVDEKKALLANGAKSQNKDPEED